MISGGCNIAPSGLVPVIRRYPGKEPADVHDRMPAIIAPEDCDAWLEDDGQDLLRPCARDMAAYPVSSRVNNPRYEPVQVSIQKRQKCNIRWTHTFT